VVQAILKKDPGEEILQHGKLVFGLSQSLDGYVDGVAGELELPLPGPMLFRHR
jgi:hypothetical protein